MKPHIINKRPRIKQGQVNHFCGGLGLSRGGMSRSRLVDFRLLYIICAIVTLSACSAQHSRLEYEITAESCERLLIEVNKGADTQTVENPIGVK